MAKRKMQYGVGVRTQYPAGFDMRVGLAEHLEQARVADRLGFDSLMRGQHFAGWPLQEIQQVPFLARVSAEAPNLRLATGIVLLPLHKPLDVAEQMAALDLMTNGKLIFGVGLGYRDVEYLGFGTSQKDRVPRFVENLEAIKRLWTEDHVNMKGSHFELVDVTLSLKPLQKPTPPIWIGANVDSAIERAAQMGDAWFINPHQKMETIGRQLDVYKRALDKVKKPFPTEFPLCREIFVAKDRETAIKQAQPYLAEKYRVYHLWGQDKAMPAGDNDLAMAYDELKEDRFLLGSPDEIAEELIQYNRRFGVNHMILSFHWVGMPNSLAIEGMTRFMEEVAPRVEQGL